jgi:hypothetical protein
MEHGTTEGRHRVDGTASVGRQPVAGATRISPRWHQYPVRSCSEMLSGPGKGIVPLRDQAAEVRRDQSPWHHLAEDGAQRAGA